MLFSSDNKDVWDVVQEVREKYFFQELGTTDEYNRGTFLTKLAVRLCSTEVIRGSIKRMKLSNIGCLMSK